FDGSTGKETEVIDEPFFLDLVGEESDEYWFVGLLIKFLHSIFKKGLVVGYDFIIKALHEMHSVCGYPTLTFDLGYCFVFPMKWEQF
ncbi:hypothetical protein SCA6_007384, partial [Theobroma cacao]